MAPGALDRCTTTPDALGALLDELEQRAERVLLLGDIFDLLRPARWRGWREQLEQLREEHPDLIERLLSMDALHGNHDAPMRARGWPEERVFHATNVGDVLAIHGHSWDVWLKKIWGMEESANFVAGWFERVGLHPVSHLMGAVPTLIEKVQERRAATPETPSSPREANIPRDQRAVGELIAGGWGVVVAGRTHGLGLYALGDGLYINSGSHAHDHIDASILDTTVGLAVTWRDGRWSQAAACQERGKGWFVIASQSGEEDYDTWYARLSREQRKAFEELKP